MTQEKLIDAITDLDSDILNRYFDMKADLAAKKKPKKQTWVKWASLAACFCFVFVGVFIIHYDRQCVNEIYHKITVLLSQTVATEPSNGFTGCRKRLWAHSRKCPGRRCGVP